MVASRNAIKRGPNQHVALLLVSEFGCHLERHITLVLPPWGGVIHINPSKIWEKKKAFESDPNFFLQDLMP
jgi:hypothetical protein